MIYGSSCVVVVVGVGDEIYLSIQEKPGVEWGEGRRKR